MSAGYPGFIIYLTLALGVPAALGWPKRTFLVILLLLAGSDTQAFTLTRTAIFGPYLNANDACTLIAIVSFISFQLKYKTAIRIPYITIAILTTLLIGFMISHLRFGWSYEVLRITRWAIALPIFYIIAANIFKTEKDIKSLIFVLFLGATLSAIQHIFFILIKMDATGTSDILALRTISFQSPSSWFLVAGAIFIPSVYKNKKILLVTCSTLFLISIIFNQTRTLWASIIVSFFIGFIYYKNVFQLLGKSMIRFLAGASVIGLIIFFSFELVFKKIDLASTLLKRIQSLDPTLVARTGHDTSITRYLAFNKEFDAFKNSNIIFGNGLWYFKNEYHKKVGKNRVAWNHLGHLTILAQLGLLGGLVYSFFLPLQVLYHSKKLWHSSSENLKFLGVLGGICIISYQFMFILTDSFLSQKTVEGALFGAIWSLNYQIKKNEDFRYE